SEDACDGVAATVVLAEDLAEEAPDGGDGTEQAVGVLDAVLLGGVRDAAFTQGVGEGQSLVARKARADLLEGGHGWLAKVLGGNGTDPESAAAEPSPDKGGTRGERVPPSLYAAQPRSARRLRPYQGAKALLALKLATFVRHADALSVCITQRT